MADNAIAEFMQITQLQKQNAGKQKQINNKKEMARQAIIADLEGKNEMFVQTGDASYLVLKEKRTKQAFTPEFLKILFKAYLRTQMGMDVTDEQANGFEAFCASQSERLGTTKVDLVPSSSRPLAVMFE